MSELSVQKADIRETPGSMLEEVYDEAAYISDSQAKG